jgi:(+)-trans-carveol dehydrogenase
MDVSETPSTTPAERSLAGRVAWVTGAASGMGRRHAERLLRAGASVGCIDIQSPDFSHISENGSGRLRVARADVSDWDQLQTAAGRLEREIGPAGIVVVNAGIPSHKTYVEHLPPAAWARVLAVNLTGAYLTAKAAIPQLRASGDGVLVFISSVSGMRGFPGAAEYNASKHGVLGLMKTLANELAPDGIRVNALCPGWVDTPMLDVEAAALGREPGDMRREWASTHLLDDLVTTDDVSNALLWLVSSDARMVTGVALPVDGGLLEHAGATRGS